MIAREAVCVGGEVRLKRGAGEVGARREAPEA